MLALLAQETAPARFSTDWWLSVGASLAFLLVVAVVLTLLGRRYVRKLVRRAGAQRGDERDRDAAQRMRRTATVTHLIFTTLEVALWVTVFLIILSSIGVNLGPLIAGAGIAGVALGFGAQTVVRDTLAGFFILLENQFDVGDAVDLQTTGGPVAGSVETLTLRITSVRAFDGTLHVIPNGNIEITSNKTRGWGRAIVDIRLAYDQDIEAVRAILVELFAELKEADPFSSALRKDPDVQGVVQLTDAGQVLRVTAETLPSRRWEIERFLRERITTRLTERGVAVPAVPPVMAPGSGKP